MSKFDFNWVQEFKEFGLTTLQNYMQFNDILSTDGIVLDLKCESKKHLFQQLAQMASVRTGISQSAIASALSEREKLGSTDLGSGVAIPHGRVEGCGQCHLFFARLPQKLNFDTEDGECVDLVFCLLGCHEAGNEPVKLISRISKLVSDPEFRADLRTASMPEEVYALITNGRMQQAA